MAGCADGPYFANGSKKRISQLQLSIFRRKGASHGVAGHCGVHRRLLHHLGAVSMRWAMVVLTWNAEWGWHRLQVARFRHWGQAKAFFAEMERRQYPALLEMLS